MKTSIAFLSVLVVVLMILPATGQDGTLHPDVVRSTVQEICPVSGEKLGDHGPPVKARIGEEEVFLCCQACLSGEVKPDYWMTIHQNMAAAQGICPVMENELPKQPKWTIVNGRVLFVCCPPCIDDIKTDPKKFAKKVDELYAKSLGQRRN